MRESQWESDLAFRLDTDVTATAIPGIIHTAIATTVITARGVIMARGALLTSRPEHTGIMGGATILGTATGVKTTTRS